MMRWVELHDNVDEGVAMFINLDNVIDVRCAIIDKSGEIVTAIDTTDGDVIYVAEEYEVVREKIIWATGD